MRSRQPADKREKIKPYILSPGQIHDLVKGLPAVILANGVALLVANMVVRCHEDADGVLCWERMDGQLGQVWYSVLEQSGCITKGDFEGTTNLGLRASCQMSVGW